MQEAHKTLQLNEWKEALITGEIWKLSPTLTLNYTPELVSTWKKSLPSLFLSYAASMNSILSHGFKIVKTYFLNMSLFHFIHFSYRKERLCERMMMVWACQNHEWGSNLTGPQWLTLDWHLGTNWISVTAKLDHWSSYSILSVSAFFRLCISQIRVFHLLEFPSQHILLNILGVEARK